MIFGWLKSSPVGTPVLPGANGALGLSLKAAIPIDFAANPHPFRGLQQLLRKRGLVARLPDGCV